MNPVPACDLRTRELVWVCPKCNTVMARGIGGNSFIPPDLACPNPRLLSPEGNRAQRTRRAWDQLGLHARISDGMTVTDVYFDSGSG